jgi:flagellar motor switch protein FliN/FliY
MSSSQTSSSSTEATTPAMGGSAEFDQPFPGLMDVTCPVSIRIGSGSMKVRECLALKPHSIVRLMQPVGNDLDVCVHDVVIAHAEVAIVDDSTSVRLTEMVAPPHDAVEE